MRAKSVSQKNQVPVLYINATCETELNYRFTQKETKETVYEIAFDAILLAHKKKRSVARLLELNYSGKYSCLNKSEWPSALQSILRFHTQNENYEKCRTISNLLDQL